MQTRRTITEQRQAVIDQYIHEHGDEPVQMSFIADWALKKGLIQPPRVDYLKLVARQLSEAARDEYYTDPQGREVRKKHQFKRREMVGGKEVQRTFWVDVDRATPKQMRLSFAFRRRANLMDNKQLQTDVESWNENQRLKFEDPPIQVSFNYEGDLADMKEATTYPDFREGEADREDDL